MIDVPTVASKKSLKREIAAVMASLAHVDLEALRQLYADRFYAKYLDLERWVPYNIRIMRELDLIDARPVKALDIGCGGGLLLYCLKHYGHQAVGIDIANPLFSDLANALGVDRRVAPVEPLRPISLPGTFDVITVVSPGFDWERAGAPVWGNREWRYFLEDVSGRLDRSGRLYLRLNHARSPALHNALAHGFAPPSKHLEDQREFIYDQAALSRTIEAL